MQEKKCSKCKIFKQLSEFNKASKRKDGLQLQCKECVHFTAKCYYNNNKDAQLKRVLKQKHKRLLIAQKYIIKYLEEHFCVDCGENNLLVLEFDHRRDKKNDVCKMINLGFSIKNIALEIEKCEVRCSNCHKIRTHKEQKSYRYIYFKKNQEEK